MKPTQRATSVGHDDMSPAARAHDRFLHYVPRADARGYNISPAARAVVILSLAIALAVASPLLAHDNPGTPRVSPDTNRSSLNWQNVLRYNTLACLAGTAVLGISAGVVGSFMLLRKRALIGDVVGHAALPGVAVAFLIMEAASQGSGKNMPGLLAGAWIAGMIGVLATLAIRRFSRIKEDASLAIVLGIFFGGGIALLSLLKAIPSGSQAGLSKYIFGMASAIVLSDVWIIASVAIAAIVVCGLLFKELSLLCFDEDFGATQGWPVVPLDLVLMSLVVCVAVVGMQSVGLLLVVALLIIPPAAARFWTDDLFRMLLISATIGGISAAPAVVISAVVVRPQLSTGPLIVLTGALFFLVSLFLGTRRGVLRRLWILWQLRRRVGRHDLLRAVYEFLEQTGGGNGREQWTSRPVPQDALLQMRSWTPRRLRKLVAVAQRDGFVRSATGGNLQLTPRGLAEAGRVIRNHRLWELYLITYADIAPSHVDRDADHIEHLLDGELVAELEAKLSQHYPRMQLPESPHAIQGAGG